MVQTHIGLGAHYGNTITLERTCRNEKHLPVKFQFCFDFQDIVKGVIVVQSRGELPHNGITLSMEGIVNLQLSAKSVGVFEAFYNSLKPIQLVNYTLEIAKPGKLYHSMLPC